jgi:hypothetical protein
MDLYRTLDVFPEVPAMLKRLKTSRYPWAASDSAAILSAYSMFRQSLILLLK